MDNNINFDYPTLVPVFKNINIEHISCGNYYSVFLTKTGNIYVAGKQINSDNQFSLKNFENLDNFTYKNLYNDGETIFAIRKK